MMARTCQQLQSLGTGASSGLCGTLDTEKHAGKTIIHNILIKLFKKQEQFILITVNTFQVPLFISFKYFSLENFISEVKLH